MNKQIYLLTIVILLLMGCKSATDPPLPEEPNELIPLAIGNYWIYEGYKLDSETGEVSWGPYFYLPGFIVEDTISLNIDGKKVTNYIITPCDTELNLIDETEFLSNGGSRTIYSDKKGIYYSGVMKKKKMVLKFNDLIFSSTAKKGDVVIAHQYFSSGIGTISGDPDSILTEYTCVSTDSVYKTSIGEFRCIVYRMYFDDYPSLGRGETYFFIKPTIGIVGIVTKSYRYYDNTSGYLSKYSLKKYKIGVKK